MKFVITFLCVSVCMSETVISKLTIQPSGIILLSPDSWSISQGSEDGRVCAHEINMDPCIQVPI